MRLRKHKNFIDFKVILIIALLSLFIVKFSLEQKREIATISVQDILELISTDPTFKTHPVKRDVANSILDWNFQSKKCLESEIIDFEYHDSYTSNICDFDVFSHYIDAKVKIGMKSELLKNEKLISILNRTYNEYKFKYASKDKLHPLDNRWNHIMNAMIALDLLNEDEKNFWIVKYSSLAFDENYLMFPQAWNRVWLFNAFGIYDIYNLTKYYNLNFSQVEKNICSYVPPPNAYKEENIFEESEKTMLYKYLAIRRFCNISSSDDMS